MQLQDIKRAHHYVWRHYLQTWETDGRLSCLSGVRVKRINAINLAVKKDFYRLPELNEAELQFVIRWAKSMPAHGAEVFKGFIKYLTAHSRIRSIIGSKIDELPKVIQALKVYQSNLEEDYHNAIENNAILILSAIKNGDVSFYVDKEKSARFMYFIANQLLRTKKLRDSHKTELGKDHGIDLAKVWQIASHFVAANLGGNLFIRRFDDPITLIVNDTDVGLITSDQPVVNLYAGSLRASEEMAVYYPVSPTKAVLFGELDDDVPVPAWHVDVHQVRRLNSLMMQESHTMAFARCEADFGTVPAFRC